LGEIDYVLLSHVHYDHFDTPTIRALLEKNPTFLVPKGMDIYLKKINKNISIHTFDWYENHQTSKETFIDFVPAKHWGRRGLFDTNRALWGGFVLSTKQHTVYFAGDTAYDTHFKEIAQRFRIDYALLPVGAYLPHHIMKHNHLNPAEAHQAFRELKAGTLIPMHYGTFKLTDEPINEPLEWIDKLYEEHTDEIEVIAVGEVRFL
jgi:L-ascorbate metabolism protein UlaG (beta-lactamase superfamily)